MGGGSACLQQLLGGPWLGSGQLRGGCCLLGMGRWRGLAAAGAGRSRSTVASRPWGAWLRLFALVCSSLPAAAKNPQHSEGTEPRAAPKKRKRKKQRVTE